MRLIMRFIIFLFQQRFILRNSSESDEDSLWHGFSHGGGGGGQHVAGGGGGQCFSSHGGGGGLNF